MGPLLLAILLALGGAVPALATAAPCTIEPAGLTLASHGTTEGVTVVPAGDGLALAFEMDDAATTSGSPAASIACPSARCSPRRRGSNRCAAW